MIQIADLHIHSKYSRACSRDLTLENIDEHCRSKGVDIIATGDFTFPDHFRSIREELEKIKVPGFYRLKTREDNKVKFVLSTEFALIYKKNGKVRRIHMMVQAPHLEAVAELNAYLDKQYNIRSDGRPILGMSIEELCRICFGIDKKFLIYPAHIWTPWFAVFGSKSGFDSWEEAFGEYSDKIYAFETGLSSDPAMNWRLSALDKKTLLSSSDAHSLPNIAREATVFDLKEGSYSEFYEVIKNKDLKKIRYTIEFYPEEGMYHYDGHRDCGICFSPQETKKHKGICPKCKKKLVIGVDYRVNELADRPFGFKPDNVPGFIKLVELDKIIAESLGIKNRQAKKVQNEYVRILKSLRTNELDILLNKPISDIKKAGFERVAEGIRRVREGKLDINPGFDGQYGKIKIFKPEKNKKKQKSLF